MNDPSSHSEYLVLSRGQWDKDASQEHIEAAIHKFYDWLARSIDEGCMKMGSRLSRERAVVSKTGIVTDGPFGEGKEIIGGYWFIVAGSLREAAELAAQNPCARYGLTYEIRPLESERASVYNVTNETATPGVRVTD
jgi:hypothetical protein